ncbi:single-stranded DNA-binding protein [Bradyrhizobium sp. CCBAU 11386]|uniref:single-stranded DNA-binding protein n=1 Tax=Bradyrhizobium sp. CCBAU 11386 TaxID=1630837 RepID=UPI002304A432|nr:single-stranded DNA-binding protein [Bradyrhizobium sp. CCBAU 11386]
MSAIEAAFFGALGRDAESKISGSGKSYLRLNVRVGEGDNVTWVSVMAFDEKAIAVADKMVKGARLYVEGKLGLDEWTAQDGSKRHGLSVMSWHCRLSQIGKNKPPKQNKPGPASLGRSRAATSDNAPISAGAAGFDDDIPFAPEVR